MTRHLIVKDSPAIRGHLDTKYLPFISRMMFAWTVIPQQFMREPQERIGGQRVKSLSMSRILAIAVLLTLLHVGNPAKVSIAAEKPNVVLIYIDDLGYGDLGCYGSTDIPTPNIDRLAREGVRCTASYITNPPCCPSRCSLMMGQYAQRFGKYGMSRGLPIPADRPTLAGHLRNHGYATGQIGKWDIGTKRQGPLKVRFTEVAKTPPKKRYSEEELALASRELRNQIAKKNGQSKYFCINEDDETVWLATTTAIRWSTSSNVTKPSRSFPPVKLRKRTEVFLHRLEIVNRPTGFVAGLVIWDVGVSQCQFGPTIDSFQ
jgi:hypothetical protein